MLYISSAKWNVILLKNDEVVDFLTSPPTDFSALKMFSTHSAQRTELAAGQLSRFHHKGPVASKFAGSKPNGLSRVGCNVGGLPQA